MNYLPKFIDNMTIEELQKELDEMYRLQYSFGYSIPWLRLCDIKYTIKQLTNSIN